MIKFLNFKNRIQKFQTAQKIDPIQIGPNYNKVMNLIDDRTASSMKILSNQILAMAEQDNKTSTGKKLNIFT